MRAGESARRANPAFAGSQVRRAVVGFIMTKTEAIDQIHSTLPALTTEQAQALAEMAAAWARLPPPEDEATLAAIAEGIAQADHGEFADPAEVDALLDRPWK